jgi:hypothetical protein
MASTLIDHGRNALGYQLAIEAIAEQRHAGHNQVDQQALQKDDNGQRRHDEF